MASFNYKVIVSEPGHATAEIDELDGRRLTADTAKDHAHRCGNMAPGTTIRIRRIRLRKERIDPRDAAAGQRARNPRLVPGPQCDWTAYRAYVVTPEGTVRRTDR